MRYSATRCVIRWQSGYEEALKGDEDLLNDNRRAMEKH